MNVGDTIIFKRMSLISKETLNLINDKDKECFERMINDKKEFTVQNMINRNTAVAITKKFDTINYDENTVYWSLWQKVISVNDICFPWEFITDETQEISVLESLESKVKMFNQSEVNAFKKEYRVGDTVQINTKLTQDLLTDGVYVDSMMEISNLAMFENFIILGYKNNLVYVQSLENTISDNIGIPMSMIISKTYMNKEDVTLNNLNDTGVYLIQSSGDHFYDFYRFVDVENDKIIFKSPFGSGTIYIGKNELDKVISCY